MPGNHSFSLFLLKVKVFVQENSGKRWGNQKHFEGISDYKTWNVVIINIYLSVGNEDKIVWECWILLFQGKTNL